MPKRNISALLCMADHNSISAFNRNIAFYINTAPNSTRNYLSLVRFGWQHTVEKEPESF